MYKTVRLFVHVSVRVCLEMTSVDKLLDLTFSLYYAYFLKSVETSVYSTSGI